MLVLLPVAGALYVLDIATSLGVLIWKEQYLGLFIALVLGSIFLGVVPTPKSSYERVPWFDVILAVLGLLVGLYLSAFYPRYSLGLRTSLEPLMGALAILLILEATRRLLGWILVVIAGAFLFYARFAHFFPDLLYNDGVSLGRLAGYLYLDANGIMGVALDTAATMVLAFVFLGSMLFVAGGAQFFTELAQCVMGRFRGGSAKVSVAASGMFGSISGSAVANVMVDGWITIPMMAKAGFRPHVAAAIEASASTGGIIMPPIMGAAAFLIAEFLAIPYSQVAIAAIVPAVLYYLVLFVQVDLEAAKFGLRGLPKEQIPRLGPVLRTGWTPLLALAALIYALFFRNLEPAMAGVLVTLFLIVLSALQRPFRLKLGQFVDVLEKTGRSLLDIGVITATAGLVIGVLSLMGLGFTLSSILVKVSGGNAFILLFLAAATCFVLGMGMPTTAAYVILAVLVVPALTQLGVVPLAAHLFLLFFAKASMISPPVCLAAYAAASIGRCDPMRTGWTATRLSLVTFVAPFVFAFAPALLLIGSLPQIFLVVTTTIVGSVLLAVSLAGYLYRPLSPAKRWLLALGGVALILPPNAGVPLGWVIIVNAIGGLLGALIWLAEFRGSQVASPLPIEAESQRA
jgi:TRAP transporter 4TM/12TM fusion protein